MDEKKDMTVISIKTVSGEDVLGYYAGELQLDYTGEMAMMIYRPIKIDLISNFDEDGISSNYFPQFYFPYGEALTPIPYRVIAHQELANPFFSRLYTKYLGDMMIYEEKRQSAITKALDLADFKEIMSSTDAMFVNNESIYLQ